MAQLYAQQSQQGIWMALGPPQSAAFVLAQSLTVTYGDGTQDTLAAHVPAVTSAGTTQVDRTGAVWLLYVVAGDPTLRIVREMDQGQVAGSYAPLARVLADRVVPYQPDNGQAQSSTSAQSFLPLTITNNSSTQSIGGSTVVPVATTGTDYVVQCHLSGSTASQVWGALSDKTSFSDLQVIFGGAEIDADIDQQTQGAWSSSSQTLWFRLQRPIAALGVDQGYQLRMGGGLRSSPLRSWANIYPFSDDFLGSALGSSWRIYAGSPSVVVAGGTVSITGSSGQADWGIASSVPPLGPSMLLACYGTLPPPTGNAYNIYLHSASSGAVAFPLVTIDVGSDTTLTSYNVLASSGTWGSFAAIASVDSSPHLFALGRDAAGATYGFVDAASAHTSDRLVTSTLYPAFRVDNANTITLDWVKCRPWLSPEPTVSAGSLQSAGGLRWEPVVDSTGSVLIAPSGDPLMALVAAT